MWITDLDCKEILEPIIGHEFLSQIEFFSSFLALSFVEGVVDNYDDFENHDRKGDRIQCLSLLVVPLDRSVVVNSEQLDLAHHDLFEMVLDRAGLFEVTLLLVEIVLDELVVLLNQIEFFLSTGFSLWSESSVFDALGDGDDTSDL